MEKPIKKRRIKNEKTRPKPRQKNRYMRGSKLSEYKFLQVLRGFADSLAPKAAAAQTRISEKTVRQIYAALRLAVLKAAKSGKPIFGMGSQYLYEDGKLTEKGAVFLDAVSKSRLFERYMADQAPRLGNEGDREAYVFDLGMRIFTGLVVAEEEFYTPSPGLQRSLILLAAMQSWIDANKDESGFFAKNEETIERHASLSRMARIVQEQQQIIALRQSPEHRYKSRKFFEDLRKNLLETSDYPATNTKLAQH